ncbi:MAG TPA: efflux RND transporter periplasmic adaptor subunit [Thermoanaerobaculia bacterium]|nr:efflux RND transporter periplasmic adaptor subunit [Thermoanaerobaculia bacterium]
MQRRTVVAARRRGARSLLAALARIAAGAVGAVCIVAALFAEGCAKSEDPDSIVASGHVEATDVHIAAKVAGRLEAFGLQEGDRVRGGALLAQIDTTDVRLALRQARADREQAAAELRLRLAGPTREEIAELAAQVSSAAAELAGAQKDLDRMQALLDRGSGTGKSRDDALARRDVAAGRLMGAREALARARAGSRREEIDAARARLGSMDARIAQLEQQASDATVVSPLAGVVSEKVAQQGELVQPGSPLCVITDLDHAWLTVYVAEPDLGRLRLGQQGELVTDAGQRRAGVLTYLSPQAEFTPKNVQTRDERVKLVFKVKVSMDNRDGLFKPGMPAEARFRAAAAAGGEARGRG